MAPPNLLLAAAANAASEPAQISQYALPTGETLDDFEPLSLFEVDGKGHLFVEQDGMKSVLERLFSVLKDQNDKHNQVGEDIYDLRSNLTAVERQCVHLNVQLKECQESVQKALIQINTMGVAGVGSQSPGGGAGETSGILGGQDQALSTNEALEDLTERFDNIERLMSSHLESTQTKFTKMEESLAQHEQALEYDVGERFERNEESMENIREDIDALRKRAVDEAVKKADRNEVFKLQEWLSRVEEGQKSVIDDVQKAQDDFKHLGELANEMVDTRHQCQELWRLVREESREVRDWVSHGLDDLRKEVRSKAVASEVCDRLESVQRDVTGLAGRMQALAHLKAQLHGKAERNEVQRLQETSNIIAKELGNHGAVLAGTTCLACSRPMEKGDRAAKGGREDSDEQQGKRIMTEARIALEKGQSDFLEYVAVNVGSPVRTAGADGRMYAGRNSPSPGPDDGPGTGSAGDLRLLQVRRPVSAAGSMASGITGSRPPSRCASPNLTAGAKAPTKAINAPLYLRPSSRSGTPDPTSAKLSPKTPKTVRDVVGGSKDGRRKSRESPTPEYGGDSLGHTLIAPFVPAGSEDKTIKVQLPYAPSP